MAAQQRIRYCFYLLIFILVTLTSIQARANNGIQQTQSKIKPNLTLATSEAPPYMIKDPVGGLDIDTVKAAMEHQGYQIDVIFVSLHRAMAELKAGRADISVPSFTVTANETGLFPGDPHILYRPTVFTLQKDNIRLKTLDDLSNYRISTFQGASGYFGPDFAKVINRAPGYHEHPSMERLIDMLISERTDLVILDYWIFDYYYRKARHDKPYTAHGDIFPRVPAIPVFNNEAVRNDYNEGLKAIQANGVYKRIMQRFGHD